MTTENRLETCPGCLGSGIQVNKDGLTVICPVCGGAGQWQRPLPPGTWCQSNITSESISIT